MKSKDYVTTEDLRALLRVRYPAPAFALFEEVGNGTGFATSRHLDCLAMAVWPSRGLEILGFELKASRSDWLRELKDPKKAEEICRFCDRFFVVTGSPDIVKDGELPSTWGLLVAAGGKLTTKVEAPKLEPVALDKTFVAAVLRRAHEGINRVRQAATSEGYERGVAAGPPLSLDSSKLTAEIADLRKIITDFEGKSGLSIHKWNAGDIGSLVKFVQDEWHRSYEPIENFGDPSLRMKEARTHMARILKQLDDDIASEDRILARIAAEKKGSAA